jgi:hypothetical protein
VDKNYDFADGNYFEFPEQVSINPLIEDIDNANLMAVKIGDINGTATPDNLISNIDSRSIEVVVFDFQKGSHNTIDVFVKKNMTITGLQFELDWNMASEVVLISDELPIAGYHYRMMDHGMRMVYDQEKGSNLEAGDRVFSLTFDKETNVEHVLEQLTLKTNHIVPEMYDVSLEARDIEISVRQEMKGKYDLHLYQNTPNPFQRTTEIGFELPEDNRVEFMIVDAQGEIIYTMSIDGKKGYNKLTYDASDMIESGVYYYQINTKFGIETRKMIFIK